MADKEFYTVSEAAEYLGVARIKVYRLIKHGKLETQENPFDLRQKLISKAQLDKIREFKQVLSES